MSELSALTGGEGYGACADDAGIAHLVERHLAKVEVASSSLVARSRKAVLGDKYCFFTCGKVFGEGLYFPASVI